MLLKTFKDVCLYFHSQGQISLSYISLLKGVFIQLHDITELQLQAFDGMLEAWDRAVKLMSRLMRKPVLYMQKQWSRSAAR